MKIKLIRDDEVVVNKEELDKLTQKKSCRVEDCKKFDDAVMKHKVEYSIENTMCGYVVYANWRISFPIKCFNSDDQDYNRICAEELVELLNQEQ